MSEDTLWPLPETWRWVTFRDVAEVRSDLKDPSATPDAVHIAPNHIESGTGRLLGRGLVAGDGVTSPKHAFHPGQILYSKIRPYLAKAVLIDFAGLCSADMYPVSALPVLMDPAFLHRWLVSPAFTDVASESQGRTVLPKINQDALYSKPVPLAPLAEQRRVSAKLESVLAKLHACRERLGRVPTLLKRFREAVLAAATSGELTREWREQRGRCADEWEHSTVGQVITDIEAGLNVQCEERPPTERERGLVKISAVTWGRYDDDESKTLPSGAEVSENSRIKVGDFLISRANTLELVGACVIVDRVSRPVFLSDKVLRLVMPDEWKPWLHAVLRSPLGRREIEARASGNQLSMRNLSQANLRDIPVPVPPPDERGEIIRRAKELLSLADALERRSETAAKRMAAFEPSLLSRAFRGELVPQDPNDEPASVLLERIRPQGAATVHEKKQRQSRRASSRSKASVSPKEAQPKRRRAS